MLLSCKKSLTDKGLDADLTQSLQQDALSTALVETNYTFIKRFDVPSTLNQQGLAYGAGLHYITYDVGSGYARIAEYDSNGVELKRTASIALGHAAEASYRQADSTLYIANGGLSGSPTYVYQVDMRVATPAIKRTIDFSSLGANGMVAVDNSNGRLLVFTGPNGGPYTVSTADFNGIVLSRFSIADALGLPQGIEILGNEIFYYTSKSTSNLITVFTTAGTKLYTIQTGITQEGEGLSVDEVTRTVYVGTHNTDQIFKMRPAFVSDALLGMNLILNPNAEGGSGGTGASALIAVPFWTKSGTTVIRYGSGSLPKASSPGSPNRRTNFFAGGQVASGTFTQQVNVSNLATDIDAVLIKYSLKGWLGGYSTQNDNAKVQATFLNGAGTALGSSTIGPVLAVNRDSTTGMVLRSKSGTVPVGTRSIKIVITMTRLAGTNCDGFADDLALVLTKP